MPDVFMRRTNDDDRATMTTTHVVHNDDASHNARVDARAQRRDMYVYDITCTMCDVRVTQIGDATVLRATTERTFRFHRTSNRYVSRCRDCERRARRNNATSRRNAQTTRDAIARSHALSNDIMCATCHTTRVAVVNDRCASCINATHNDAYNASRNTLRIDTSPRHTQRDARRFGVEIECVVPNNITRASLRDMFAQRNITWTIKGDCSIRAERDTWGAEIVSPPTTSTNDVRIVCDILRACGVRVNASCGLHVHHDASDFENNIDALRTLCHTWANTQNIIDGFVSSSRRRDAHATYCGTYTHDDAMCMDNATTMRDASRNVMTRYKTLNIAAYASHGTIEIRQHAGTIDADKIITWIGFGRAMIDYAMTHATNDMYNARMENVTCVRAFLDALRDHMNDATRTFMLGRAVDFAHVAI